MQFRSLGRLSLISRISGVGYEMIESLTGGGWVVRAMVGFFLLGVWKTRTGQGVWESWYAKNLGSVR